MENVIRGVILIVVGGVSIIFRKMFVRGSFSFQNKAFGFRFSEKEVKGNEWTILFVGLILIALGLLSLLGIIWN